MGLHRDAGKVLHHLPAGNPPGAPKPVRQFATARSRKSRAKKPPLPGRDTPAPVVLDLRMAMGRWERLSYWWTLPRRELGLWFPETLSFVICH